MTPPKVSANPDKIKYVVLVRGRWVYRPYIAKKKRDGLDVDKFGYLRPILLGKESAEWHTILEAHAAAVKELAITAEPTMFTLRWVADQYERSEEHKSLSAGSVTKNKTLRKVLDHKLTINGKAGLLGEVRSTSLTKPIVNTIRNKRLKAFQAKGRSGYSHCNREITYLSTITRWASNYYDQIKDNPFLVKKLKENVNTRYVNDDEYYAQMAVARTLSDYLVVTLELIYLLSSRGCEALTIQLDHITTDNDGDPAIFVKRTKGSNATFIKINPRMQAAIDAAMALRKKRKIVGKYLIVGTNGPNLIKSTLDDAMGRLRDEVKRLDLQSRHSYKGELREAELKPLFWRMHDLKRKGVSDSADKGIAGHKSPAMQNLYDTKIASFNAPD